MKAYIRFALSALCVFAVSCGHNNENVSEMPVAQEEHGPFHELGFCTDSMEVVSGKVKSGQFFSTLLGSLGMSAKDAYDLTMACDSVFDVKKLRVGNDYNAYYSSPDSTAKTLEYLVYERDRESQVVFSCRPPFMAKVLQKETFIRK